MRLTTLFENINTSYLDRLSAGDKFTINEKWEIAELAGKAFSIRDAGLAYWINNKLAIMKRLAKFNTLDERIEEPVLDLILDTIKINQQKIRK